MFEFNIFFLESRVCASSVVIAPCSAVVFAHKVLRNIKICPGKKLQLPPGFNFKWQMSFCQAIRPNEIQLQVK